MSAPWLFLHGINNAPAIWQPITEALHVTSSSQCPLLPARDSVDEIALELAVKLERPHLLVGHSFGGYVALALLEQRPELVAGIVLINSHARADTDAVRQVRAQSAEAARKGQFMTLVEAVAARVYHPANVANTTLAQQRLQDAQTYGEERFIAHQAACARRPDRSQILREYSGPKLVLASEQDLVIDPASQKSLAQQCGADFQMLKSAGHMLPAEQPLAVAEALAEWVAVRCALNQAAAS